MSEETWWVIKDQEGNAMAGTLARGPGEAWVLYASSCKGESITDVCWIVRDNERLGYRAAEIRITPAHFPNPDPENQSINSAEGGPPSTS